MSSENKVLLTGATGLLGANVAAELVRRNYPVRVFVRKESKLKALENISCETVTGDLTRANDLEKALEGCSFVIHCAALTMQVKRGLQPYYEMNVAVTERLARLSLQMAVRRFVYISSANCFAPGSMENPGDESGAFLSFLEKSGYAYSKLLARRMVLKAFREKGLPAIILAPTTLIGPRDARPSSGQYLLYGLRRGPVFYPPGGKSFLDAELAAESVVNALEMGCNGEEYLLAGANMTYREFFREIAIHRKGPALLLPIPRRIMILAGYASGMAEFFTGRAMPLSRTNQRLLCLDNYFSGAKARRELGLRDTSVPEAIRKAIEWFRGNGYLS